MKRGFVDMLRSPGTVLPLRLADGGLSEGGEIITGRLVGENGEEYRIENGVPIILENARFADDDARRTYESFCEKWQLTTDYREKTTPHYQAWFLERFGFSDLDALGKFLPGDGYILDVATAHGRDMKVYAERSNSVVVGLDYSPGINLAYRDLHQLPNANFVRADMTRAPFAAGTFDMVACDQALHHTPNTYASLRKLFELLKPGGKLMFYVYRKKALMRELADEHVRAITTKLSVDDCYKFSEQITALGKALSDLKVRFTVPTDIPLMGIKAGEYDIQRFIYYAMFKCYWNESIDWHNNVMTNFDWYHPPHAHRHTAEEVRGWCNELKLDVLRLHECDSGISVVARKQP
jgi:SAM-dependent methyltransferase